MTGITVCTIARNEETNLGRALSSVMDIADDLIVVDTGSADATRNVAMAHGARVFDFAWCDDFAAARNEAFAQARTKWTFLLDADEWLLEESKPALLVRLSRDDLIGFFILRQDYFSDSQYTEMLQLRVFRGEFAPKQVGRCHADFSPRLNEVALKLGMKLEASPVRIGHSGYLGPLKKSKLERAERLLELELRDRPGSLYYEVELARTKLQLGKAEGFAMMESAMQRVADHKDDATPSTVMAAVVLEHALAIADRNPLLTEAEVKTLTERWFPNSAPLWFMLARAAFMREDYLAAASRLERLRELIRSGNYDRSMSFDPNILGDEPLLNLGVCYVRLGKLKSAQSIFESLLNSRTFGAAALSNLRVVQRLRKAT